MVISLQAKRGLERLARHNGISQTAMLERLILDEQKRVHRYRIRHRPGYLRSAGARQPSIQPHQSGVDRANEEIGAGDQGPIFGHSALLQPPALCSR